jgi:hypothetical protein
MQKHGRWYCPYQTELQVNLTNYKIIVFWDVTSCSLVESYQHFGGASCFHLQSRKYLYSYIHLFYPEGGGSASEMLLIFYQTRQNHIPEDSNLHTHCHENLKALIPLTSNNSSCFI